MKNRRLWLEIGDFSSTSKEESEGFDHVDTYEAIFLTYASRPTPKPLLLLVSHSLVLGQELILTCLLLASHRVALLEESNLSEGLLSHSNQFSNRLTPSIFFVWVAFLLVVLHNKSQYSRRAKLQHRFTDGVCMAIFLRFLSAVLKTLTASYSSDTVHALAILGLFLHLLACDYSYANGFSNLDDETIFDTKTRPAFKGGTVSLTAVFFATTLLASRLESNATVYIFICSSMTLFALFPSARYQVAINTRTVNRWGTCLFAIPFPKLATQNIAYIFDRFSLLV